WTEGDVAKRYARGELATRPFAEGLVRTAGLANATGNVNVLDIAAGTGAVEAAMYAALPKDKWNSAKVLATDISESMLAYLKSRGEEQGWSGLETKIMDGAAIDLPQDTYTHVFVNFGIFVMPLTVVPTCKTLLIPGGFIGITTWSYLSWVDILSRAIARLSIPQLYCPIASEIESKMYNGHAWNDPLFVVSQLNNAGFQNVEFREEEREVEVGTPEQFMLPMALPLKMISSTWWKEEEREE
ncbi:S-adenosyl-L-methionine-dependent methyltransferase, partial [Pleomassaria siparia CBS 279.74]